MQILVIVLCYIIDGIFLSLLNVAFVQRLVEQFQTDAKTRVAVLSMKAAGVVST